MTNDRPRKNTKLATAAPRLAISRRRKLLPRPVPVFARDLFGLGTVVTLPSFQSSAASGPRKPISDRAAYIDA
jgi:hypothetical protein